MICVKFCRLHRRTVTAVGLPYSIVVTHLCAIVIGHIGLPIHNGSCILIPVVLDGGVEITHKIVAHYCYYPATCAITTCDYNGSSGCVSLTRIIYNHLCDHSCTVDHCCHGCRNCAITCDCEFRCHSVSTSTISNYHFFNAECVILIPQTVRLRLPQGTVGSNITVGAGTTSTLCCACGIGSQYRTHILIGYLCSVKKCRQIKVSQGTLIHINSRVDQIEFSNAHMIRFDFLNVIQNKILIVSLICLVW